MAELRLVTRGDDAGSAETADRAILEAFRTGILRNTSVLAPGPTLDHAAALLAGERGLCCGLHCCLTAEWDAVRWGPVLPPEQVPELVDGQGCFPQTTRAVQQRAPAIEQVLAELGAQLDRLCAAGFDIRYADCHMGFLWTVDGLEPAWRAWCEAKGLVHRLPGCGRLPEVEADGDPVERLLARLAAAPAGAYLLVGHPAHDTPEMRRLGHAGYDGEQVARGRDWERRLFCDPRVVAWAVEHDLRPLRYDQAATG